MTAIPTTLARWYAAHSSVRRLWAVEAGDALTVFVSLEPTSDGDDPLPLWLANSQDWADDLTARASRDVQLKLIASGVFEESDVDTGAELIAELSWRDSWTSQ
jgi:hypothetical protein